ncbi:hypothetical protein MPLDJ20_20556 [Mesorhizobium plurifarium]|uniref:Uncharacterized protein n=1 Tax=Mesorhizobium plurifarium TaxID=69974 RepID=A0A090EY98_MESPL|nr:hypothetical protein MPLDJ20_20556 [Mesorhizobium plurifarium]CDX51029.1 hypothetical protein MPL3365_130259 [Mesorhizobium plurifarium]
MTYVASTAPNRSKCHALALFLTTPDRGLFRLFEAVLFQYDASDGRNCYGLNIIGRHMHIAQKCTATLGERHEV